MLRKNFFFTVIACAITLLSLQGCTSESPKPPKHAPPTPPPPKEGNGSTTAPHKKMKNNSSEDGVDLPRLSEAFGHFIGRNLSNPGAEFDIDTLVIGIRNGAEGKPQPMSDEEYEEMMTTFQERAFKALASQNLEKANDFLNENKDQPGIVVLEPGKLQYLVLEEGDGETVNEDNTIKIRYQGTYIDGTPFGSSDETGGSVTISPKQTIPGFQQGIIGMKKGEKRKIFVHPDLGYGTMGQLPPNQLLIFEIELLDPNAEPPQLSFSNLPEEVEYDEAEDDMGVRDLGEFDENVGDISYPLGEFDENVGDESYPLGEGDENVGDTTRPLGEFDTNVP